MAGEKERGTENRGTTVGKPTAASRGSSLHQQIQDFASRVNKAEVTITIHLYNETRYQVDIPNVKKFVLGELNSKQSWRPIRIKGSYYNLNFIFTDDTVPGFDAANRLSMWIYLIDALEGDMVTARKNVSAKMRPVIHKLQTYYPGILTTLLGAFDSASPSLGISPYGMVNNKDPYGASFVFVDKSYKESKKYNNGLRDNRGMFETEWINFETLHELAHVLIFDLIKDGHTPGTYMSELIGEVAGNKANQHFNEEQLILIGDDLRERITSNQITAIKPAITPPGIARTINDSF